MGSPAIPPPGGQPQQQGAEPPSWKKILLGMIPVAGPLLMAHEEQEYRRRQEKTAEVIQSKQALLNKVSNYKTTLANYPELQQQADALETELMSHNIGGYEKPFTPQHMKAIQDLSGRANAALANQATQAQAQSGMGPALQPPGGGVPANLFGQFGPPPGGLAPGANVGGQGMIPQGATRGGEVNAPPPGAAAPAPQPQAQAQAVPGQVPGLAAAMPQLKAQFPALAPVLDDPIVAPLLPALASPIPSIVGQARAQIERYMQDRVSAAQQMAFIRQRYPNFDQLPEWMKADILMNKEVRIPPVLKPGEQVPGVAGGGPMASTEPRLEKTALGETLTAIPPVTGQGPGGESQTLVKGSPFTREDLPIISWWNAQPQNQGKQVTPDDPSRLAEAKQAYTDATMGTEAKARIEAGIQNIKEIQKNRELQRAELGQRIREFEATKSPTAIAALGNSVLQNPDAISELTGDSKTLVAKWLADRGLPIPKPIDASERKPEDYANLALSNVAMVRQMMQDPDVQPFIGPATGRLANMEQDIGASLRGASPAQIQKVTQLRAGLQYLFLQEGASLLPRQNPALMKELEKVSPRLSEVMPQLQGQLNSIEQQAQKRINANQARRWGSASAARKAEQAAGGGTPTLTPPPGAKVLDADTAKAYLQKAGGDKEKARKLAKDDGYTF